MIRKETGGKTTFWFDSDRLKPFSDFTIDSLEFSYSWKSIILKNKISWAWTIKYLSMNYNLQSKKYFNKKLKTSKKRIKSKYSLKDTHKVKKTIKKMYITRKQIISNRVIK